MTSGCLLSGCIFERSGCQLPWREVLDRLQLGGKRKYGWGRVCRVGEPTPNTEVFGYVLDPSKEWPEVTVDIGHPLLAHTVASGIEARGQIEPFLGREMREAARFGEAGLKAAQICWVPGSRLAEKGPLLISTYGLWQASKE